MADGHDDCRICRVVHNPLPHEPVPDIDWAANRAFALADRRLDRDPDLPDEWEAS